MSRYDLLFIRNRQAPKADERDRIDFIFYKGKNLEAKKAIVFGPKGDIVAEAEQINEERQEAKEAAEIEDAAEETEADA